MVALISRQFLCLALLSLLSLNPRANRSSTAGDDQDQDRSGRAGRAVHLFRNFAPPTKANYDLTPHETRILKLLVEGHNYKTAAVELGVTVNTISFHVRHVYEKLQVHSKSEAVAKALKNKLV